MRRIDKVFSIAKRRALVVGIEIDFSASALSNKRQWRQLYVQILFWEFSILFAWDIKEEANA